MKTARRQVRVAISTSCNLSCEYCVMKNSKIRDTFYKFGFYDFQKGVLPLYDDICITGGIYVPVGSTLIFSIRTG